MYPKVLALFLCLPVLHAQNTSTSSNKRGLIYVWPDENNDIWTADNSTLTWYYNYQASPTEYPSSIDLPFVPMMWGNRPDDQGFYDTVKGLIDGGTDVKYVLGFNEPDICKGGGSCVDPGTAARVWKQEIEPLKKEGVKLGTPAVVGGGAAWLTEFFTHCAGECTTDFIAAHWYGDAAGLAGWLGYLRETYPNMTTIWVTEFALQDAPLLATEEAFNGSVAFMDQQKYITHYSYFGSFRRNEANDFVGPNVAMLNNSGGLTEIGAWYLGLPLGFTGMANVLAYSWWHLPAVVGTLVVVAGFY